MARHSKWHNIQVRKGAMDSKRGKIFTKHAKLIEIAAREGGGDPMTNATLRTAMENARAYNVPNANIERAIKKGTGELSDGTVISEIFYEGYAPGGVALLIQTLTDNKNRACGSVKILLSKNGGVMGSAGSVAWMFERKGVIVVEGGGGVGGGEDGDGGGGGGGCGANGGVPDIDALQLAAIDAGAEDVSVDADGGGDADGRSVVGGLSVVIFTAPTHLDIVRKSLSEKGYVIANSELDFVPKTTVAVDEVKAQAVLDLISLLEDDEDVTNVYHNME